MPTINLAFVASIDLSIIFQFCILNALICAVIILSYIAVNSSLIRL